MTAPFALLRIPIPFQNTTHVAADMLHIIPQQGNHSAK
ncbi:hypothetical protein SEH50133_03067 [Salmonella enterica subsp. houtenae serovar 50:g,z51:- str. 01-0133]|nr:hypothetical protein SEH50133_03067 [Salmonella enterica subsp. houtenae serovar 50:g,z51:- str. 01-0133]